ncbi:hydrolase [Pseudomonas protegens]|nr:hydrolase [Pseudomonas protegens]
MATQEPRPAPARGRRNSFRKMLFKSIYNGVLGLLRCSFWIESRLFPQRAAARALKMFTTPQRLRQHFPQTLPSATVQDLETDQGRLRCFCWTPPQVRRRVVLVHGWSGASTQWQYLIPLLLEEGCEVLSFDCIGHGGSGGRQASLPTFVSMLDQVQKQLGPFDTVIGHSLGGAAAGYALSTPVGKGFQRAVLVAAPADIENVVRRFGAFLWINDDVRQRMQLLVEQRYQKDMASLAVSRYGRQVEVPVLLVHDQQDQEVPADDLQSFAEGLRHRRVLQTRGLGHLKILKDSATMEAVVEFVCAKDGNL